MLSSLWNNLLFYPTLNLLILFYKIFFANLGLAIIALTLFLRLLLYPVTVSSLRAAEKQRELKDELEAIKGKHKGDKRKQAEAQMELFKKHGINPAAGCLPQVFQFLLLITLYQVFLRILGVEQAGVEEINKLLYHPFLLFPSWETLNTHFLYLNLSQPDPYVFLPGLAGAAQFWASKVMLPQVKKQEVLAKETSDKKDDLMYNMQEQMLYFMPLMTVFIGWKLPSGLVLYWLATTLFSLGQQLWVRRGLGLREAPSR